MASSFASLSRLEVVYTWCRWFHPSWTSAGGKSNQNSSAEAHYTTALPDLWCCWIVIVQCQARRISTTRTPGAGRQACLKLLLQAGRENKHSLCSLGRNTLNIGPLVKETCYHLKLNRFGRHGLDSTNLFLGLWPVILAPMKLEDCDADALSFFIQDYFMRHSYHLRHR